MDWLDVLNHLINFIAPVLALALALPWAARWIIRKSPMPWWKQTVLNGLVGVLALTLSLWWWGRDGKMAAYAVLLLAAASSQWLLSRGWRR
jgi:hypothetical protein